MVVIEVPTHGGVTGAMYGAHQHTQYARTHARTQYTYTHKAQRTKHTRSADTRTHTTLASTYTRTHTLADPYPHTPTPTHSRVVESCTKGRWSRPRELQSITRCDSRQRQMRGHQNPPTLAGKPAPSAAAEGRHATSAATNRHNTSCALDAICSSPRPLGHRKLILFDDLKSSLFPRIVSY